MKSFIKSAHRAEPATQATAEPSYLPEELKEWINNKDDHSDMPIVAPEDILKMVKTSTTKHPRKDGLYICATNSSDEKLAEMLNYLTQHLKTLKGKDQKEFKEQLQKSLLRQTEEGANLFHAVAYIPSTMKIRLLLKFANEIELNNYINSTDGYNQATALHHAAKNLQKENFLFLLEKGADVLARTYIDGDPESVFYAHDFILQRMGDKGYDSLILGYRDFLIKKIHNLDKKIDPLWAKYNKALEDLEAKIVVYLKKSKEKCHEKFQNDKEKFEEANQVLKEIEVFHAQHFGHHLFVRSNLLTSLKEKIDEGFDISAVEKGMKYYISLIEQYENPEHPAIIYLLFDTIQNKFPKEINHFVEELHNSLAEQRQVIMGILKISKDVNEVNETYNKYIQRKELYDGIFKSVKSLPKTKFLNMFHKEGGDAAEKDHQALVTLYETRQQIEEIRSNRSLTSVSTISSIHG